MTPYVSLLLLLILGCSTRQVKSRALLDPFETKQELELGGQAVVKIYANGHVFNGFFLYNDRFIASDSRIIEACGDLECKLIIEYNYEMRRYPKLLAVKLKHISTLATSGLSVFELMTPNKSSFKHLKLSDSTKVTYAVGHPIGGLKKFIRLDSKNNLLSYVLPNIAFSALLSDQGKLVGWVDISKVDPENTFLELRFFSDWPITACLSNEKKICYPYQSNRPRPLEGRIQKLEQTSETITYTMEQAEKDPLVDLTPDLAWSYLKRGRKKFRQVDLIEYFVDYKNIKNYREYAVSIAKAYTFFLDPKAIIARSFLNDPLVTTKAKLEIEELLYRNYSL